MIRVALALALALATATATAVPASAQASDCGAAATQLDANMCAGAAAKQADAALNAMWAKVTRANPDLLAKLRAAQRAWIAYRDLACAAEAAQYDGGSIMPMIAAQCVERLTRARTADLATFLPQ